MMSCPALHAVVSTPLTFATFRSSPLTTDPTPHLPMHADASLASHTAFTERPPSPQTAYVIHGGDSMATVSCAADRRRDDAFGIHVNFVWRSMDVVNYPRGDASRSFSVMALNAVPGEAARLYPGSHLLLTRATSNPMVEDQHQLHVARRCTDFNLKGCCRRGLRCTFAHVVTIGETGSAIKRRLRPSGRMAMASESTAQPFSVATTTTAPAHSKTTKSGWWYHDPYAMGIVRCASVGH